MSKYYSTLLNVLSPAFSSTKSMAFDGVDDFINCGAATYLDGLTTATISLWVQPLTTGITDVIRRGNTSSSDIRIWIYPSSDRIDFGIGSSICRTTTTTLNVGTWYHIYACYDKDLNNGKDMISAELRPELCRYLLFTIQEFLIT